jgi:hypothetical protein
MITCQLLASLMRRSPQPVLPLGSLRRHVVARREQARVMTYLLQRIQDRLVGILRSASVLLAGEVITVRVDDVPRARADERRRRPLAVLA